MDGWMCSCVIQNWTSETKSSLIFGIYSLLAEVQIRIINNLQILSFFLLFERNLEIHSWMSETISKEGMFT